MRRTSFALGLAALLAAACSSSSAPVIPAANDAGASGEDGPDTTPPPPLDGAPGVVPSSDGGGAASETGAPSAPEAGVDAGPNITPAFLGGNEMCLESPLPAAPGGGTSCIMMLSGVPMGCGQPGLSPATPEQITAFEVFLGLTEEDAAVFGNLCQLAQLPASTSAGTDCSSAASGWCYVPRACAADPAPCSQAICITDAFAAVANYANDTWTGYTSAFLYCP